MPKKKDFTFRYYCVAFLDILNQREKIRKIRSLPQGEDGYQRFVDQTRESLGEVRGVRRNLLSFFEAARKKRTQPRGLDPYQQKEFLRLRQISKQFIPKTQSFSDTVVLYVPISTDDGTIFADGLYYTLFSIASVFPLFLSSGTVIRGGVDVGIGVEVDSNEIYGPAVLGAYDLESKVAQYPRIVMGQGVAEFIQSVLVNPVEGIQAQLNKDLIAKCQEFLFEDGDGRWTLDYLGQGHRNMSGPMTARFIPKAIEHLHKEFEAAGASQNTKLFLRYNMLCDYFEARLPLWEDLLSGEHAHQQNDTQ